MAKYLAMAELDNILIFVKVARFESINRAARSLGMPISTVSRRLSVLESEQSLRQAEDLTSDSGRGGLSCLNRQLGVTLSRRTTRRVMLKAQGPECFNQCQEPLSLPQDAERVCDPGSAQAVLAVYPSRRFVPSRLNASPEHH